MEKKWDDVYKKELSTNWYPMLGIVRFSARYLKRRTGIDLYQVKKDTNRILDVGCGNGNHVVFFAEQGFNVYGIDISGEAIEIANDWLARKGLKADLRVGDIEKLPFDDGYFDVVVSHGVLDHIPFLKAKKAMEEIKRVLLPRGYVFITLRSTEDSEFGRGKEVEHNAFLLQNGYEKGIIQHYFGFEKIRDLFKGFEIFDLELHEEKFPASFTVDKAFLQSSKGLKKCIDMIKPIDLNLKYSRWYIAAEKEEP